MTPDKISNNPLRSDTPLIEELYKSQGRFIPENGRFDPKKSWHHIARCIRSRPLFVIPNNMSWLFDHEAELLSLQQDHIHLPFNDFMVDLSHGGSPVMHAAGIQEEPLSPDDTIQTWMRIRYIHHALSDPHLIFPHSLLEEPIQNLKIGPTDTNWILIEFWIQDQDKPIPYSPFPGWIIFPLHHPTNSELVLYLDQRLIEPLQWIAGYWMYHDEDTTEPLEKEHKEFLLYQEMHVRGVILAIIYMTEYASLLKVSAPNLAPRDIKTARLKPWLLPRPSAFISIDLNRLSDFDHPSTRASVQPDERRRPYPHDRRGHWRMLPAGYTKSKTWVRPTWIGETIWQDRTGTTYEYIPSSPQVRH